MQILVEEVESAIYGPQQNGFAMWHVVSRAKKIIIQCLKGQATMTAPPGSPSCRQLVPPASGAQFPKPEIWSQNSQTKSPVTKYLFCKLSAIHQHTTEVETLLTRQISICFRRAFFQTLKFLDFQIFDFNVISLQNLALKYRRKTIVAF